MFRLLLSFLAIGLVLYGMVLLGPDAPAMAPHMPAALAKAVKKIVSPAAERAKPAAEPAEQHPASAPQPAAKDSPTAQPPAVAAAPPVPAEIPPLPETKSAPLPTMHFVRNVPVSNSGEPPDLRASDVLRPAVATGQGQATTQPATPGTESMPPAPAPVNHEDEHNAADVFAVNRANAAIFAQLSKLFDDR
jgi:hypothetical protein